MSSKTMIEVKNITKQFERKIALSSLSFSIKKGEIVALIGPSGAGKTTLTQYIARSRSLKPDEGDASIAGTPANK